MKSCPGDSGEVERRTCESSVENKDCSIECKTLPGFIGCIVIGICVVTPTQLTAAIGLQNLTGGRAI